ncbi:MAG: TolC family protein [Bdellovibrionales bacterium]|nr:TolC family protein [Bdellovibrionales bacterium]
MRAFICAVFVVFTSQGALPAARPLSFREALNEGITASREIKESEELVRSAKSVLSGSSATFFPTVNLLMSAGTFHDRQPVPGDPTLHVVPRDRNQYNASIQGTQVLFSGFSSFAESARAKAGLQKAEENKRVLEFKIVTDIVEAYFGIQNLQRKLASETEILKVRQARLDQVMSRLRAGRATDLEEIQARLAIQSQEPAMNSLRNDIEARSLQLNRLLGKELTETYRLSDELTSTSYTVDALPPLSLAQAYEKALQNSPEIKKVEAAYEEVVAELRIAEATQFPRVSLNFQAGSLTPLQREIGSQESINYGAAIEMSIPLFSGFSSIHAVSSGKSKIEAALERRAFAREQLFQNLQQTFRAWEVLKKNIESSELSVKISKRGTERSESLYGAGRATMLDVLDSYTKRLEEERKLSDALFDRIRTIVKFRNLIGERL